MAPRVLCCVVLCQRPHPGLMPLSQIQIPVLYKGFPIMAISQCTRLLPFHRRPAGDKYELVFKDCRVIDDPQGRGSATVYRIRALRTIRNVVRRGQYGGYVQSLDNLSHRGDCWVSDQACLLGHARVWGNALVGDQAVIREQSWVFEGAAVYGQATVAATARIFGQARVYGQSYVGGHVLVAGQAVVAGHAQAVGCCWVGDTARLEHDVWLSGNQIVTDGSVAAVRPLRSGTTFAVDTTPERARA